MLTKVLWTAFFSVARIDKDSGNPAPSVVRYRNNREFPVTEIHDSAVRLRGRLGATGHAHSVLRYHFCPTCLAVHRMVALVTSSFTTKASPVTDRPTRSPAAPRGGPDHTDGPLLLAFLASAPPEGHGTIPALSRFREASFSEAPRWRVDSGDFLERVPVRFVVPLPKLGTSVIGESSDRRAEIRRSRRR